MRLRYKYIVKSPEMQGFIISERHINITAITIGHKASETAALRYASNTSTSFNKILTGTTCSNCDFIFLCAHYTHFGARN